MLMENAEMYVLLITVEKIQNLIVIKQMIVLGIQKIQIILWEYVLKKKKIAKVIIIYLNLEKIVTHIVFQHMA